MASEKTGYSAFPSYPVTGPLTGQAFALSGSNSGAGVSLGGTSFSVQVQISNALNPGPGPDHLFIPPDGSFDLYTTLTAGNPPLLVPGPIRWIRLVLDSGTLTGGNIVEQQDASRNVLDLASQISQQSGNTINWTTGDHSTLPTTPGLYRIVNGTEAGQFWQVAENTSPVRRAELESLTLTGIVDRTLYRLDTLTALRAKAPTGSPLAGQIARTLGATTVGDNGGALWYWDDASTAADDGLLTITVSGVNPGRWKRIRETNLNVWNFGAKGDYSVGSNTGTDNTTAFQTAIDIAKTLGQVRSSGLNGRDLRVKITVPAGAYLITAPLVLPRPDGSHVIVELVGDGSGTTIIVGSGNAFLGRALIEWEAVARRTHHPVVRGFTLIPALVANAKCIAYTPTNISTAATVFAEYMDDPLFEDIICEGDNSFHQVSIDLQGLVRYGTFSRIRTNYTVGTAPAYSTILLRTTDTILDSASINFDSTGFGYCRLLDVNVLNWRGGYGALFWGRLHMSTWEGAQNGIGGLELNNGTNTATPNMYLRQSSNSKITNYYGERQGEDTQILVENSTHIEFEHMNLGSPKVSDRAQFGIRLVNSQACTFRHRYGTSTLLGYSRHPSGRAVVVDSTSGRNEFKQFEISNFYAGEIQSDASPKLRNKFDVYDTKNSIHTLIDPDLGTSGLVVDRPTSPRVPHPHYRSDARKMEFWTGSAWLDATGSPLDGMYADLGSGPSFKQLAAGVASAYASSFTRSTVADLDGVSTAINTIRVRGQNSAAPRALIEPASTNNFQTSTAPATQTRALSAGTYTCWIEGTGSITLSGSAAGTVTAGSPVTYTLGTSGSVTFTVVGTVTFAQNENLPFATSKITTAAGSVTRSGDSWRVDTLAPLLSSTSVWTVTVCVKELARSSADQIFFEANTGGTGGSNQRVLINRRASDGQYQLLARSTAGATSTRATTVIPSAGTWHTLTVDYNAGSLQLIVDGVLTGAAIIWAAGAVPMTQLQVGGSPAATGIEAAAQVVPGALGLGIQFLELGSRNQATSAAVVHSTLLANLP